VQEFVHLCVCKTERQRDRETERQRDRETERQRDREAERQRDRETKRQRERQREILSIRLRVVLQFFSSDFKKTQNYFSRSFFNVISTVKSTIKLQTMQLFGEISQSGK
jgi:hypothetical protein